MVFICPLQEVKLLSTSNVEYRSTQWVPNLSEKVPANIDVTNFLVEVDLASNKDQLIGILNKAKELSALYNSALNKTPTPVQFSTRFRCIDDSAHNRCLNETIKLVRTLEWNLVDRIAELVGDPDPCFTVSCSSLTLSAPDLLSVTRYKERINEGLHFDSGDFPPSPWENIRMIVNLTSETRYIVLYPVALDEMRSFLGCSEKTIKEVILEKYLRSVDRPQCILYPIPAFSGYIMETRRYAHTATSYFRNLWDATAVFEIPLFTDMSRFFNKDAA